MDYRRRVAHKRATSRCCEELFAICFANKINQTGWHAASAAPVWKWQNSKRSNKKENAISFLFIRHLLLFGC